jgi:origin recognition complex subunit 1
MRSIEIPKKLDVQERARKWLTKGGILREDSDDELGYEDHPWEWIYEKEQERISSPVVKIDDAEDDERNSQDTRRRASRAAAAKTPKQPKIIGARMGGFQCCLGEVVLLKSPEAGKNWAGIICEFLEEEDEDAEDQEEDLVKSAKIMWLASPDEFLSSKRKKRADALFNEQYLTADFNVNPLTSINGKAIVMSKDAFYAKYPNGASPQGKGALAEYRKCIVCRRGVNQVQGKYTEEFVWEDVYKADEQSVCSMIDMIKEGLRAAKKRKDIDEDVRIPSSCLRDKKILTLAIYIVYTQRRRRRSSHTS